MDEKERLPQVQNQIADLEEAIETLHDSITTLTTALEPILRDEPGDC